MLMSRDNEMRCPPPRSVLLMELMSGDTDLCLVLYGFDEQQAQQEIEKVHFLSICCIVEIKHESQDA